MRRFFLLIAFLSQEAVADVTIERPDLTASYTISDEMPCHDVDHHHFIFYFHFTLNECVIQCGLRDHCSGLQYNGPMSLCMLFTDGGEIGTATGSSGKCFYVWRENIQITQMPCIDTCNYVEVCDIATEECKFKDCPPVQTLTNGKVLGNRRSVGDTVRFLCNSGYKESRAIMHATCLDDGTWSDQVECVLDNGEETAHTTLVPVPTPPTLTPSTQTTLVQVTPSPTLTPSASETRLVPVTSSEILTMSAETRSVPVTSSSIMTTMPSQTTPVPITASPPSTTYRSRTASSRSRSSSRRWSRFRRTYRGRGGTGERNRADRPSRAKTYIRSFSTLSH